MICIVVAQIVMCLYVQMCMSILGVFIISSVVMVGWLSVCLLLVCCVVFFSIHIARHAIYRSLLGIVLITCWGFQTWRYTFCNCYFTKCWVACQSSARLNNVHAWNLYKRSVSHKETSISPTPVEEYGWTFKQSDLLEHKRVCFLRATFHRSEQQDSLSFQTATEHIQHSIFVLWPLTPPEIWWHFIDGLNLARRVRIEGRRGRGEGGGEGGVIAVVAQWLWRRLDDWVHL